MMKVGGGKSRNWGKAQVLGFLGVLAVLVFFNSLFFDSYLPITEGWFHAYAMMMGQGKALYKDLYFFLPPLYPLTIKGLSSIIGEGIYNFRMFGVGLILAIATLVYGIFLRFARPWVAVLLTILVIFYLQSGVAHIGYDFLQFVIFFSVLATFWVLRSWEAVFEERDTKTLRPFGFLFLAGVALGCGFLYKQSNGFVIAVSVGIGAGLAFRGLPIQRWLQCAGAMLAGFGSAVSVMAVYLFANDLEIEFWEQVVQGAASAKGSLSQALFSWMPHYFSLAMVRHVVSLWYVPVVLGYWFFWRSPAFGGKGLLGSTQERARTKAEAWRVLLVVGLCLGAIGLGAGEDSAFQRWVLKFANQNYDTVFLVSGFFSLFGFGFVALRPLSSRRIVLLYALSLGVIWGAGTSGGLTESGIIVAVALLGLWFLESFCFFGLGKVAFVVLSLCLVTSITKKKLDEPYSWWGLKEESARAERRFSHIEKLSGMKLTRGQETLYRDALSVIEENRSKPGGVLAFPHIPIFYYLADMGPSGKAVVHWFDFLPDALALEEQTHLRENPPAVLFYMSLPEEVYVNHERLFRRGQPSGQRAMRDALLEMVRDKKRYRLYRSYEIPEGFRLEVWVKT